MFNKLRNRSLKRILRRLIGLIVLTTLIRDPVVIAILNSKNAFRPDSIFC